MDVIAAYREVGRYRGAAEICGTTHKTVKRIVERARGRRGGAGERDRGHNYDEVADAGRGAGARRRTGRISAKRLLPAARAAGYEGSARNFRRLVAEAKQAWRRGHHRGRRPGVWSPGETLIIDWGVLDGLHVFCAVLAWSRFRFVRFADDEKAATTLALLAECFEVLGGVPKGAGRPDGLSEGRGGRERGGADPGLCPLRHPLRVPARLLRGRPGIEGHRREPGRLRQARPDDPAATLRRPDRREMLTALRDVQTSRSALSHHKPGRGWRQRSDSLLRETNLRLAGLSRGHFTRCVMSEHLIGALMAKMARSAIPPTAPP